MYQRTFTLALILFAATQVSAQSPRTDLANKWIDDNLTEVVALYKELHQTPELSFEEEQTAARMAAELRKLDCEVVTGLGGHGVIGILRNGEGKTLMLRADMDALPVVE